MVLFCKDKLVKTTEATEAEGQEEELEARRLLGQRCPASGRRTSPSQGPRSEPGQAHVGEAVVDIDPFVKEHDADGHQ